MVQKVDYPRLEMEMAYGINIPLVATPEAWRKDKEKVLHFYSMRMENCLKANPNLAHQIIFEFEEKYNVQIVTPNIDNLHERAGGTNVLHLHGEIMKVRSCGTD